MPEKRCKITKNIIRLLHFPHFLFVKQCKHNCDLHSQRLRNRHILPKFATNKYTTIIMRKVFFTLLYILSATLSYAQTSAGESQRTVAYSKYQPAIVTKSDGHTITIRQANIFLKNSHLLFKRGTASLEATMDGIAAVDFQDRHYVRVDSVLAYVVDSIGPNRLLCSTRIDMTAYLARLRNNREVTNLQIGDMVSVSTTELSPEEDCIYPLVNYFYFDINGKVFRAEERTVLHNIDKSKRRMMKTVISFADFTWGDPQSLMKLLKAIL